MQQLYTTRKIFRVVQPNNSLSEYVVNKQLVDDKSGEIQVVNNITVGKYDVVYVAGSTLPSNRYAELEFYMDAYKNGIIDRQEVLKKTEVFDMEGVMQRTDIIGQLQQQLQGAQEQIKSLKGDLQTRDREAVNLRKKVEVEKFKTELDSTSNKAKAASTLFEKRLGDEMSVLKRDIAIATKPDSTPSGQKGSQK
jgi:peptidoglycan hydrolase CwlO-like protein